MFDRKLFLGFLISQEYENALLAINPQLFALFIHTKSEYLHEIVYHEQRYLGRFIPSPCELSDLELLETHIYSLLKRLVPDHSYENNALWLFPVVEVMIPDNHEEVSVGRN